MRAKVASASQLLIALFELLSYIDNVRSGFGTRSDLSDGVGGAKVPIVSSSSLFFTHLDRRQRPTGHAPWRDDQVRGRRRASFQIRSTWKFGSAIAGEATRSRSCRQARRRQFCIFRRSKCTPISKKASLARPHRRSASQEVRTAITERAYGQVGSLSPRRRQLRDAQKTIELVRSPQPGSTGLVIILRRPALHARVKPVHDKS